MFKYFKFPLKAAAVGALFIATSTSSAFALNLDSFKKTVEHLFLSNALGISSDNIEMKGNDIIYHDAVISPGVEELKVFFSNLNIGDVVFENVAEDADGSFDIEKVAFKNFTTEVFDFSLSIKDYSISDIHLFNNSSTLTAWQVATYKQISLGELSVSNTDSDKPFFVMKNMKDITDWNDNYTALSSNSEIGSIDIDFMQIEDPRVRAVMALFGYTKLSGTSKSSLTWDGKSGVFNFEQFEIDIDDLAKINMAFKISNLTIDVLKKYVALNEDLISGNIEPSLLDAKMKDFIESMAIDSFTIRYEDKSIFKRIINFMAMQQGLSSENYILMLKATLPELEKEIDSPLFAKSLVEQLGLFLDNPKSFAFNMKPEIPMTVTMIEALVEISPDAVFKGLNISIEANK